MWRGERLRSRNETLYFSPTAKRARTRLCFINHAIFSPYSQFCLVEISIMNLRDTFNFHNGTFSLSRLWFLMNKRSYFDSFILHNNCPVRQGVFFNDLIFPERICLKIRYCDFRCSYKLIMLLSKNLQVAILHSEFEHRNTTFVGKLSGDRSANQVWEFYRTTCDI